MRVLIALLIGTAIYLIVRWLISKGRSENAQGASGLQKANSIPMDDAKSRGLELLRDRSLFDCTITQKNGVPLPESLPSGILDLLHRFDKIEALSAGNPRIDRALVGQEARQRPYILVGRGMEGSDVEFDLGVLPGDEKLYEIYSNEAPDPRHGIYSTVYHWIVATAARS